MNQMPHQGQQADGSFYKNGALINAPYKTSEGKTYVIDRSTNNLVALDRPADFDNKVHMKVDLGRYFAALKAANAAHDLSVDPTQAMMNPVDPEAQNKGVTLDHIQTRYEELKAKGWTALKGPERTEFQALKVQLNIK